MCYYIDLNEVLRMAFPTEATCELKDGSIGKTLQYVNYVKRQILKQTSTAHALRANKIPRAFKINTRNRQQRICRLVLTACGQDILDEDDDIFLDDDLDDIDDLDVMDDFEEVHMFVL